VLSGALKIADKVTVAMEAVGDKIRLNSQGWDDARVIGERQGADAGAALPLARAPAGGVRAHRQRRLARGGLWARRLRMSEQETGLRHAVASAVTRDETRNTFDEERVNFGE
jgi:hypothetical protein